MTLQAQGRLDEALASYRRAVAIEPANPTFFIPASAIEWTLGKTDESRKVLERGLPRAIIVGASSSR